MVNLIQSWLLDPTAMLFLASLILIVYLRSRRRTSLGKRSMRLAWLAGPMLLILYLLCSAPILVNPLVTTLEGQYPADEPCDSGSHIVVLGGGVSSGTPSDQHFDYMSRATLSRATAGWRIAQAEPGTRLLVAGGAIGRVTEASVIANFWIALGIEPERIIKDDRSSNTYENALNVLALFEGERIEGAVRLITSAMHMPRAMNTFSAVFAQRGIVFCPVGVDRQALFNIPGWAWMPQTTALVKFDKWLHEIIALLIYRIRGWI